MQSKPYRCFHEHEGARGLQRLVILPYRRSWAADVAYRSPRLVMSEGHALQEGRGNEELKSKALCGGTCRYIREWKEKFL